ncbi:hypothetical protein RchiOBHm_Chr6g0284371 [Rosa chinensis]|uniref:Secreted protein n=1 Tax=Rosa chinensis TaxID=74649 RepID=A0A2P6PU98_ROSCH|nr:hypothetical protein RchiOBHm_Chr6g0284371 [Rosa chinensis]
MASCEHRWTRLLLLITHVGVVYDDLAGNVEIEANIFTVAIGQRRVPATSGHKPQSIRSALSLSSCSPSFITQIEAWRKKA